MIRGFYTALSGLLSSMARQSVVADDIANANTVGFKQSRTSQNDFELGLSQSIGGSLGALGTAALPTGLTIDRSQGPIEQTGLSTDLAIEGDGLFEVRTPTGVAYTRSGNFQLDARGVLSTAQGYPVLDTAGRSISPGSDFTVSTDGSVSGTGQRLALAAWPPAGVSRLGSNLFGVSGQLPPATGQIHQGVLERSNVDLAGSMTDLMNFQRAFQLSARALSLQDGTVGEATELGRLR